MSVAQLPRHDAVEGFHHELGGIRNRLWLERVLVIVVRCLAVGFAITTVGATIAWMLGMRLSALYLVAPLALALGIAALVAVFSYPSAMQAALIADRRLQLDEQLATAAEVVQEGIGGPVAHAQVAAAAESATWAQEHWRGGPRIGRDLLITAALGFLTAGVLLLTGPEGRLLVGPRPTLPVDPPRAEAPRPPRRARLLRSPRRPSRSRSRPRRTSRAQRPASSGRSMRSGAAVSRARWTRTRPGAAWARPRTSSAVRPASRTRIVMPSTGSGRRSIRSRPAARPPRRSSAVTSSGPHVRSGSSANNRTSFRRRRSRSFPRRCGRPPRTPSRRRRSSRNASAAPVTRWAAGSTRPRARR